MFPVLPIDVNGQCTGTLLELGSVKRKDLGYKNQTILLYKTLNYYLNNKINKKHSYSANLLQGNWSHTILTILPLHRSDKNSAKIPGSKSWSGSPAKSTRLLLLFVASRTSHSSKNSSKFVHKKVTDKLQKHSLLGGGNKKLSWWWQTRATHLDISQGHQTEYHSIR